MPAPKDQSQPRLTARFRLQIVTEVNARVSRGMCLQHACQELEALHAANALAEGRQKPFSLRSASNWVKGAASLEEKAALEPAGPVQMYSDTEYVAAVAAATSTAERAKLYSTSEKGKAIRERYSESEEGKATRKRYRTSEEGKATRERYDTSEKGKAAQQRKNQRNGAAQRQDRLQRNMVSESIVTAMPISDMWSVSTLAASRMLEAILAYQEELVRGGKNAVVYSGIAGARTLGGCLRADLARIRYDQGWGGEMLAEDSPKSRVYEELRHFRDGDSLQQLGGGGLPLEWCLEHTCAIAIKLPDKACTKTAEVVLHTEVFRSVRNGTLRSLIYEPLPGESFAGLLTCESSISAGASNIPGAGYLFVTFVPDALGM